MPIKRHFTRLATFAAVLALGCGCLNAFAAKPATITDQLMALML